METATIADRQAEIVTEFEALLDWEERYRKIIELGKTLPPFPEEHRTDQNKVKGCQSQVWLFARIENGKVVFDADSDAAIVRGLVAMLLRVYSNQPPKDVIDAQPDFIGKIGLGQHLSPTRSNGLLAMVKQIKYYAMAFNTLLSQG